MPRSSPSTKPIGETVTVEVVELDREVAPPPPSRRRGRGLWWLGVLAAVVGLVSFLPTGEESVDSSNVTIPDPMVATTTPAGSQSQVAFISDDRFAIRGASGLDGYRQFSNTVEFDDAWWLVAQETVPASTASLMRSVDGTEWEAASTIEAAPGHNLDIARLALIGDALAALGTEGPAVGPDFHRSVEGAIKLWRSANGTLWVPEVVAPAESGRAFQYLSLATSGGNVMVQAESHSIRPYEAAGQIDSELQAAIRSEVLSLQPSESQLGIWTSSGFLVSSFPLASDPDRDTSRFFRSNQFTEWEEVEFDLDFVGQIVRVPEGGFLVTSNQGIAFTSAFGNSWKRNPRSDMGSSYQSDDQRMLMQGRAGLTVVDLDREERFLLPSALFGCHFAPSRTAIAAVCSNETSSLVTVSWQGMELTRLNAGQLSVFDPSTGENRIFNRLGDNRYLPETKELVLTDEEGIEQVFPLKVLDQLAGPGEVDHSLYLSRTGLEWERAQAEIVAPTIRPVGAIADGFLFTFSSGPFDPLTTIIGRLHN